MTPETLDALVRKVVSEVIAEYDKSPKAAPTQVSEADEVKEPARGPRHRPLPAPRNAQLIDRIVASTPAKLVTGRTGTRYLTRSYLGLRADHSIALDAVESELPDGWAEAQKWLPLRSSSKDHQAFLLHPETGRRLDTPSRQRLEIDADKDMDVQLIAGDGLSAVALMESGPLLIDALLLQLREKGLRVGRPLCVKFARIGVQDEIGVVTRSKSTLIIVGERPGLGTGDSLSIYTAYGPKLGQDNSEKDCISNVRKVGFTPTEAAKRCAELMVRSFQAGGGGVKLASTGVAAGGS